MYAEPEPWTSPDASPENAWYPFENQFWFEFAHHHFVRAQASEDNINVNLDLLKAAVTQSNGNLKFPWLSAKKMYEKIDQIQAGPVPFRSYDFQYCGPCHLHHRNG